jgi:chaperonin GroES
VFFARKQLLPIPEITGGLFMNVPLQPLGTYIVAISKEEPETRTSSGIYLPENVQEKPKTAKVLAVGSEVKMVKTGEDIVFKSYTITEVKMAKENYIILKEEDVLATVK